MSTLHRLKDLLRELDGIGARLDDPDETLAGAGEHIAQEIQREHQRKQTSESPGDSLKGAIPDEEPDPLLDGTANDAPDDEPILHFPGEVDPEKAIKNLAANADGTYRQQIPLVGIDALGYYVNFHQRRYQWGIYLPISGIAWVAERVFGGVAASVYDRILLATKLILSHERFHLAAELGLTQMEMIRRKPIFINGGSLVPVRQLEERAANAFMLRRLQTSEVGRRIRASYRAALAFTRMQPPGYRDAHQLLGNRAKFDSGIEQHALESYFQTFGCFDLQFVELQRLYPLDHPADLTRCPVFLLSDEDRFGVPALSAQFIQVVPDVTETPTFLKRLQALGPIAAKQWRATKEKLAVSVHLKGLDFKPWRPGGSDCFSVRTSRELRAHLRFDSSQPAWTAVEIGHHKEMGHG